ncbi:MATE family efflux transporter [Sphingomonas kyeonggiensis]|uniref:Putative MATE family efflux protein n=1 Tax=Sphingomonas kyeonggiensis TaxID=1268553 RepID=A0A7W6JQR7_9SPHN|nr:MATE family efflux transporter [Sphingomonas kyeonggiensis]MBB4097827.1 putative MATE family efflux protein [Sphingomonas kyeonggiensis]
MAGPPQRHDLTQGPIGKTLLLFALPTLGSNILQSLNGSINSIWVGRFLGEQALAATSNANIIMFLMFSAVFGFGMAATILIGQSMGRRDVEAARRAFGSAIGLVMGGAVVIAILGWLFAPQILHLLATPGEAQAMALAYLRVIFLGLPFSMLGVLIQMSLRGTGDSITPLWFMLLSVIIDAGLNPLLIEGIGPFPRMGIAGSATATLIAGIVSSLGLLFYVYLRDLPIRLRGAELRYLVPEGALVRTIVAKGLPMGAQMLVMSTAGLTMIGLVNRLGVDTAAAYAVSQQLWTYIQMPAMAIGVAVSSMAAQNIGAGKWERVGAITRSGLVFNTVITLVVIGAIILFDRPVMALFVGADSPAIPIARHIQLLASWTFVMFGATMVLFSTVRANGATVPPLVILAITLFPIRFGFAFFGQRWFGSDALWLSFPIGSAFSLLFAGLYYRHGRWRTQILEVPPEPATVEEETLATTEPAGRLQPNC